MRPSGGDVPSSSLVKQPAACAAHFRRSTCDGFPPAFAGLNPSYKTHPSEPSTKNKAPPARLTVVRGQARHAVSLFSLSPTRGPPPQGGWSAETALVQGTWIANLAHHVPARQARRARPDDARARASRRSIAAVWFKSRAAQREWSWMAGQCPASRSPPQHANGSQIRSLVPVGGSPRPPGALVSSTRTRRRRSPRSAAGRLRKTTPLKWSGNAGHLARNDTVGNIWPSGFTE